MNIKFFYNGKEYDKITDAITKAAANGVYSIIKSKLKPF
jgi:hypothetical protein